MKTSFLCLILAIASFLGKAAACDCLFIPNFCETITFGNNGVIHDYTHVYLVTVTAKSLDGMKVLVSHVYHGEDQAGQELFITSGDGGDCNMFTSGFNLDEQLIVALYHGSDGWFLGECGVTFLKVENGQVVGQITPSISQLPLSEFSSLGGCGDLTLNTNAEPSASVPLIVRPSLAHDEVLVRAMGASTFDLKLCVFDVAGRLVYQTTIPRSAADQGQQVPIGDWARGLYFFRIDRASKSETFKVVKA